MLPHEPLILKVSRIYRDARRLHGQGPYKDHLWLCVRTGDQDWTGRPTFYFEIAPDYYSYGMGFWCAAPALMALYRQRIDADPKPLEKLVRRFDRQQTFRLTGPEYARSKGQVSRPPAPVVSEKIPVPAMGSPAGPAYFQPPAAAGDSGELPGACCPSTATLQISAPLCPVRRERTNKHKHGRRLVCRAFCGAVKCGKNPEICRKCLNSVKYSAMIQLSSVRRKAHGLLSFLKKR